MLKNGILKTLWSRRDETIELFQARQECRAVHLRIHIFFFKKKVVLVAVQRRREMSRLSGLYPLRRMCFAIQEHLTAG
jgi:hypothetical protein